MTYIKKEKYGLRTYKGIGLASAVLGSMVVVQNAHAEMRDVNLNGWRKTFDPSRQITERKVDYGNSPVAHDTADGNVYNEAIRSMELVSENGNTLRYRITLKDGVKLPHGAHFVLGFTGIVNESQTNKQLRKGSTTVGELSLTTESDRESSTTKMNKAKTITDYLNIFESIKSGMEPLSIITIRMSDSYLIDDTARTMEFDIVQIPRQGSGLYTNGDSSAIYDANGHPHAKSRTVKTALINPKNNTGIIGGNLEYYVEINKVPDAQHNDPLDITPNIQGVRSDVPIVESLFEPSVGFDESLTSSYKRTIFKSGDLIKGEVLNSNSLIKPKSTHKIGDVEELSILERDNNRNTSNSFIDTSRYFNVRDTSSTSKDVKMRLQLVSIDNNSVVWKVLDDVVVTGNSIWSSGQNFDSNLGVSKFKFKDDWISQLGSDTLSNMVKSGKRSIDKDSIIPGFDGSRLGVRYQLIRNGNAILTKDTSASIDLNKNYATGTSSTGTLKVQYVDENGTPLANVPMDTLAENKPWATVVKITPKIIPGYTYIKSDGELTTLVGTGERVVKLYYKKNKPTYNYIPDDTKEPPFRQEKPHPNGPTDVIIGTKPTKKVTEKPFKRRYEADPTKDVGTKVTKITGKKGTSTVTTTYKINNKTGDLIPTVGQPTVVNPVDEVIVVGTKPKIDVVRIPITTIYKRDDTKDYGGKPVETPGREGKKTTTTTYKMDENGNVTPNTPKVENVDMVPRVITIGTKPTVVTETLPRKIRYIEDKTRTIDNPEVITDGSDGKIVRTTTYDLDVKTGKTTAKTPTDVRTEPKERVLKVGKLPKIETKPILRTVRYIEDLGLPKGEQKVVTEGADGKSTTTIPYIFNPDNGTFKEGTPKVDKVEPKEKVIKVGIKPKVVTEVLPRPIRYIEDKTKTTDKPEIVAEGGDGKVVTTTPVILNPKDGSVSDGKPIIVRTEPKERIIKVGKLPKIHVEKLPKTIRYVEDPTLPKGEQKVITEGEDGKVTTTTPYELNPKDGTFREGKSITERVEPKEKVIKVGTQPKVVTEVLPRPVRYIEDKETNDGKPKVVTEGEDGKIETRIPVNLNPKDGSVTDGKPVITRIEPKEKVVKIGKKPRVEIENLPRTIRYLEDPDLPKGEQKIVTEGEDGKITKTTPFELNPKDGTIKEGTPVIDRVEPKEKVIKVGIKPDVRIEKLPRKTIYIEDPNKPSDEPEVVSEGEDGKITTTIPYILNPKDGSVTDGTPKIDRVEPKDRIIKVKNKPKVTEEVIPKTIEYIEDPNGEGITVIDEGEDGKIITRIPRKVNPKDGAVVDGEPIVERVDPRPKRVRVGVKPKITEEVIPRTTRTIDDPDMPKGERKVEIEGEDGKIITRIPRKVSPKDGSVVDGEPIIERIEPKERVEKIGTRIKNDIDGEKPQDKPIEPPTVEKPQFEVIEPKESTETIDRITHYIGDPDKPNGELTLIDDGEDGKVITTITRQRNTKNGAIIEGKPVVTKRDGKPRVISVGIQSQLTHKVLSRTTRFVEDKFLENGQTRVVYEGNDGYIETRIAYSVDEKTGEIRELSPEIKRVDAKERIIAVGTKAIIEEREIPMEIEYIEDDELTKGQEIVEQVGHSGRVRQIHQFTVNSKTGKVTEVVSDDSIDMVKRIVRKGTKSIEIPNRDKVEQKVLPNTGDASMMTGVVGSGLFGFAARLKRRKRK